MARVRVLPDRVANQIAAGEVVERPASVVKELVENGIDAGATRIEVEFRNAGSSYLRVEDNGCGMGRDDALMALERHATSKIAAAADLDALTTMGFRGEALPAIASVSRFLLQTREATTEGGTEILVDGGRLLHARDCGMPPGTRVTIGNLFSSVPARRKFLKSPATEAAHIVQCVRLHALARPEIGFTLLDDGRIQFRSPACANLQDRVTEIFGRQLASQLVEVDAHEDGMRLRGLIGKPSLSRASRHEMLIFVNNRPVENRTLGYALVESYYGHIPRGRYPVAFLFLDVPPDRVDVNVHPAKREVRFRDEAKARGFAVRTILHALRGETEARLAPLRAVAAPRAAVAPVVAAVTSAPLAPQPPERARLVSGARPEVVGGGLESRPSVSRPVEAPVAAAASARAFGAWTYLGWSRGEFAVFNTERGLALLDVRAAEQRVWYERLLREFSGSAAGCQRLLLPQPVELDPVSAATLEENIPFLARFGLEVAPFGRNFYRIEGAPSWMPEGEVEAFLSETVALLRQGKLSGERGEAAAELVAKRAAKRAARLAGEPLREEIEPLLEKLFSCETPLVDPEGKPTLIELSASEIDRRFGRRASGGELDLY